MLMSYVGATQIHRSTARCSGNFGVGLRTVREPMLLAGVASLWLFFLLLRRIAGDRAALIGCALLACDSLYLLTTCFDWGPVALQHLLLIGGALWRWSGSSRSTRNRALWLAAFSLWPRALGQGARRLDALRPGDRRNPDIPASDS